MRVKTIIELLTLSSSIYYLAKDSQVMDRINELTEKGKDNLNKVVSESQMDEDGNELEFIDKLILKTHEVKEELEEKISELVTEFYEKVNIAHVDEVRGLKDRLEKSEMTIALLEARLNKLEATK